ncbi:MAG TPA: sensor histidine kinase [Candidatus Dormibacteraeota bacterium]|nr:sensor histidine kinase [Candidatus Dormibacteraeota bacterium]
MISFFRPIRPLFWGWLLSCVGWGLVALVLGLNFVGGTDIPWTRALHAAIRDQLPWVVLTPLIFRFAARHLIDHANWKRNLAPHLMTGIVVIWGIHQWKLFIDPGGPGRHRRRSLSARDFDPSAHRQVAGPPPAWDFFHFASVEIPIYLMIISAAHTLHFYRRAEMQSGQLARARLQALQMQIHPHFLFNTLNAIAGLIHKAPDKAEAVVQMLGDLLHFLLRANPESEIPLEREINFIEKYLAIMHVRFDNRVRYEFQIAPDTLAASVPALLLQPIVENAIKHGLEAKLEGGKVTIQAQRNMSFLHLRVFDTGVGIPNLENIVEGIGLTGTRARLQEFYGDAASLEIFSDAGTTVLITIPFRPLA